MAEQSLALPDEQTFTQELEAINRFQRVAHARMIEGHDFGVIPGTSKPTLLKPGAEKIAKLLGLADTYEILDRQEDWQRPFFRYLIKCRLTHLGAGATISEGLGECNSMEDKYRWRESKRKCPYCDAEAIIKGKAEYGGGWLCFGKKGGCGAKFNDGDPDIEGQTIGRVENEDIYSQVNTLVKMAKKRALVDAALSAGRLSDVFTQDIEDIPGMGKVEQPLSSEPDTTPPAPVDWLPSEESPIDIPPIINANDLLARAKKEFGMTPEQVATEGHLARTGDIGKRSNEELTEIWQGIVAVRRPY